MARLKVITLAPTATDDNAITTSETLAAARLSLLINGVSSAGYDRDGIATSQTPSGANAMTLDGGTLDYRSVGGVIINIYAVGADTARTFTVVGTDSIGDPLTEDITGPGAGLITHGTSRFFTVISVTPDAATAGAIEIGSSGIVTFDTPQHVTIVSAGNDSGDTFTVTGEDRHDNAMTEAITGANIGTAVGTKNFAKVRSVVSSGASAGGVEVGVDGLCESGWFYINYRGGDFEVGIGCDISSGASLTFAIQHTFHDIQVKGFVEDDAAVFTHATITGKTANADGNYASPPKAIRSAITAHASGSLNTRIIQVSV